jgi:tetratricopeptide (TPR) repeat protein
MKEQADISANLYAWALNDIDKALQIRPKEYLYNVEKAIVQLRVGNNDEAIYNAQQALKVNSEGSDAYKVLGIANAQKKNKAEALKYLQKAKELGDTQVDEWIKKLR